MAGFLYTMPFGIPGNVSRSTSAATTIETAVVLTSNPPTQYGNPVAVDASTGHVRPIGAGDTTANIYGALVRPFPLSNTGTYANQGLGSTTPPTSGVVDVITEGYLSVLVKGATAPVKDGAVYVQTVADTGLPVGSISAASDTGKNFVWVGAYFTGTTDSAGNAEIHARVQ